MKRQAQGISFWYVCEADILFFLLYKSGATSGWITVVLTTLRFKTQAKKQKCNQSQLTDMTLPKCKLNMNDSKAPQRRKHKLFVQLTNFTGNVMENYCRESIAPFDLIFQIILILFFILYYLLELLKCSYNKNYCLVSLAFSVCTV